MNNTRQKIAFVLAASSHGPLIVNRFDQMPRGDGSVYGVGGQILESSAFDPAEIDLMLAILRHRRTYFGDGVSMIDCGANIGVHTVEAALEMTNWGSVVAVEAQERLYYALAGNIALNNCFNARAINAAVAAAGGTMIIPAPDYCVPGSFGSLELKPRKKNEDIGQPIDRSAGHDVKCVMLDWLNFGRVDFVKIDVEGMEQEVIAGGAALIARCQPVMMVEWVKSDKAALRSQIEGFGYRVFEHGMNLLAIHPSDKTIGHVNLV